MEVVGSWAVVPVGSSLDLSNSTAEGTGKGKNEAQFMNSLVGVEASEGFL